MGQASSQWAACRLKLMHPADKDTGAERCQGAVISANTVSLCTREEEAVCISLRRCHPRRFCDQLLFSNAPLSDDTCQLEPTW